MKTNSIGLDIKQTAKTINLLNKLLGSYQQFYMNLRGFHWNVKGNNFFELHLKFEELYNDVNLKVDEVAERILSLEGIPLHTFSAYQKVTAVKEVSGLISSEEMVKAILKGFKQLLKLQRELLEITGENEDEGTNSLMSDYITQQEKTVWMLKAYLG